LTDWSGLRVVVIGLARQGKALARYLSTEGAEVIVSDRKPADQMGEARRDLEGLPIQYVFGGHPLEVLAGADRLCLSGGVPSDLPIVLEAARRGIPILNDSEIFLESCPCQTVGITGSAGKSTTTALLGAMATADDSRRVWVGGNIGRPLLADLTAMTPDDLVVVELSSFQLEWMTVSPNVAAVLNITPNHLDRHRSMAAYTQAKAHILTHQSANNVALLSHDDPGAWALRPLVSGRLASFGYDAPPEGTGAFIDADWIVWMEDGATAPLAPLTALRLRGGHNRLNALAASGLAMLSGLPKSAIRQGLETFVGLPHRLEFVRSVDGADWYDDSIATAPERTLAALAAFESEPIILLAGGRDKDLPWETFAETVSRRVDHLVLFGEAAAKIAQAMHAVPRGRLSTLDMCGDLESAVSRAHELSEEGDVVLLAPGGTSFDAFVDFEERGERFKSLVNAL
jgi:UDP-N-acetylmuramoylalanine--D-glutamate ligase